MNKLTNRPLREDEVTRPGLTRIMIVEDEAMIALDVETRLVGLGYEVSALATSGEAALERAAEDRPDLVLMDIRLAGKMDGIEAAEVIRSTLEIPVIFATAHADAERLERAKLARPYGYLLKPIQDRDLKVTLEMALYTAQVERKRKRAEEALSLRTTELTAANEELRAFTYSVSHDLRAPLRHINLLTKFLLEDYGDGMASEARDYLEGVVDTARRMATMVEALLELSHLGRRALNREMTDLGSLVKVVCRNLETEMHGRQVDLKVDPLPVVDCDPSLAERVFFNLLSNAVKYTQRREHTFIHVGHKEEGEEAVVFVRDNGVGFNMKHADHLFGAFQRLHHQEEFEGTGAGLAIVKRIVERHGGRVWAEAELDRGATFYFTLGASKKELK